MFIILNHEKITLPRIFWGELLYFGAFIQFIQLGQICVGKIFNYISGETFSFGGNFLVGGNLKSLFLGVFFSLVNFVNGKY